MEERPYKILVVDDEPDVEPMILQRLRRDIRAGRYSFVFAPNGVAALEALRESPDIDMVLSDINMPEMDGLTLLQQIPQVDPDIRAVIVSAYGDMKNIRTAMNRGAFDFVTKPLDFEDLQLTINRTLQHMFEWREARSSHDKLIALQNELDVASEMQQSILPTRFPNVDGYEAFAKMEPAREVGGDFYDLLDLGNGRVGLVIADVSDKGVPAGLFMMVSRTLLKSTAAASGDPSAVVGTVNGLLQENNESSMFVTLVYAIYDPANATLTYSNGGHDSPLVIRSDGTSTLVPSTGGIALGLVPSYEFRQETVLVSPGDTVLFYTDGVTEAMNGDGEEFGMERLQSIFANAPPVDSQEATERVFEAVHDFAGGTPQSDDVTCLALFHRNTSS